MNGSMDYESGVNKGRLYYDELWPGFVHGIVHELEHNKWYEMAFPDGFHCYTNTNPLETELQYNENILNQVYFQPEISLKNGDTVINAGANIGIFDLYLLKNYEGLKLYSVEPVPQTFAVLSENLKDFESPDIHLVNKALSDQNDVVREMTFFPHLTGNSTIYPEIKTFQQEEVKKIATDEEFDFFYKKETIKVKTTTLSQMIELENISCIDLLKIDTEGSELDILNGIAPRHWDIIQQIAMEVHGVHDHLDQLAELLKSRNFIVTPHHETLDPMDTMVMTAVRKIK